MKNAWKSVLRFLSGKKTYLLVVALFVVVAVLVATGHLTAETGWATLLVFLGLFAAGFRSAISAHPADAERLFTEAVTLFRAALAKDPKQTEAAGLALATDGAAFAQELQPGNAGSAPPATSGTGAATS